MAPNGLKIVQILAFKVRVKILSTNQIAGFFKLRDQVFCMYLDEVYVDTVGFDGCCYVCPKHSKYQVCKIFAIFQERRRNKVDFLHVDKHQAFLKVDVTGFGKQGKSSSKYLKLKVCKMFAIYQERMRDEVDFFCG